MKTLINETVDHACTCGKKRCNVWTGDKFIIANNGDIYTLSCYEDQKISLILMYIEGKLREITEGFSIYELLDIGVDYILLTGEEITMSTEYHEILETYMNIDIHEAVKELKILNS